MQIEFLATLTGRAVNIHQSAKVSREELSERLARLAPPPAPQTARRTPLTIAALEKRLPMALTRYMRNEEGTLTPSEDGKIQSLSAIKPWSTYRPVTREYIVTRYIDGPGLAALSRKMGAKVVFEGGLSEAEYLAARRAARHARRAEAARIDADRAAAKAAILDALRKASEEALALKDARAARRAALKADRTAAVRALAGELTVTPALARRALADAGWSMEGARNALSLAALKAERERALKKERTAASDALTKAPGKVKTALKVVSNQVLKGRIALALAALKGRFLATGLKAALATTTAATTPDAVAALTTERLERIIDSAVDEERIRREIAAARKLKRKAAIKARTEEVANLFSRAKGGEKGVPQALTLAITLARKVRG